MSSQIVYLRQTFLNDIVNGFGRDVFLIKKLTFNLHPSLGIYVL